MIDKVIYLILEGLKNIFRNKGTSFTSSLLLSISIFVISMIIVANDNTQKVLQYFRGKFFSDLTLISTFYCFNPDLGILFSINSSFACNRSSDFLMIAIDLII